MKDIMVAYKALIRPKRLKYGDETTINLEAKIYEIPHSKMELYDKNHPHHDKLYRSVDAKVIA